MQNEIRNIHVCITSEFYYDDVIVTSFIHIKINDVAINFVP